MYYVIWPYDHRKATILSTHAIIKDRKLPRSIDS